MSAVSRVPTLVELSCQAAARLPLDDQPAVQLRELAPHARACLLRHAIDSGTMTDTALQHFAGSSLDLHRSRVTDRGLRIAGEACGKQLLYVNLVRCTRLRDAGVMALARRCPQLQVLHIAQCRFTDEALECAARSCPELREVDYSWNGSGVGDRAACALAKCCPQLERIAMCGSRLCDDSLLRLAHACPRLCALGTRGCDLLSESGLTAALCLLPRIQTLELAQIGRLSEPSLALIASRTPAATRLDLSMCARVTDVGVGHAAAALPKLATLECFGIAKLVAPTIASTTLTRLVLSGCRALQSPVIDCANLEQLEMQSCREVSMDALERLGTSCPHLATLDLSGCAKLPALRLRAAKLRTLLLRGCVGLSSLDVVAPALEELSLRGCERCDAVAVESVLRASPHLALLDVRGCNFDPASLAAAPPVPVLRVSCTPASLAVASAIATPVAAGAMVNASASVGRQLPVRCLHLATSPGEPCPVSEGGQPSPPAGSEADAGQLLITPNATEMHTAEHGTHSGAGSLSPPPKAWLVQADAPPATGSRGSRHGVERQPWAHVESLHLGVSLHDARKWEALTAVLMSCESLHTLSLFQCHGLHDDTLSALVAGCGRLASLTLRHVRASAPALASASLLSLSIFDCIELAAPKIQCPRLQALQTSGLEQLASLTLAAPLLTKLSLDEYRQLALLELGCPALTELDLSTCTALTSEQVQRQLLACTRLHVLRLSGCRGLHSLQLESPSLRVLYVCWCTQLQGLRLDCPALSTLYAYGCTKLDGPAIEKCAALATFELQKCGSVDDGLIAPLTAHFRHLECLNLTDCKALRAPRVVCARLQTLHLYNCVGLTAITLYCPALDLLNLTHCSLLATLSLVCPKLVTMLCAGCKLLPDEQVQLALRTCTMLSTCDVKGCALLSKDTIRAIEDLGQKRASLSI